MHKLIHFYFVTESTGNWLVTGREKSSSQGNAQKIRMKPSKLAFERKADAIETARGMAQLDTPSEVIVIDHELSQLVVSYPAA